MKKGIVGPLIIIGVALIALVVTAAFAFGRKSNTQPTSNITQPSPSPSPQASASNETANWRLYTNKEFGFSIKYPSNFSFSEGGSNNIFHGSFRSPNLTGGDLSTPIRTGGEIVIWIEPTPTDSLEQILGKLAEPGIDCCAFIVKTKTRTQLDNTTAYKGVSNWGNTEVNFILSIKNGKSYNLTARVSDSDKAEINRLFEQMVSTFKFTE